MSPIVRTLTPPGVAIVAHNALQRPVPAAIAPESLR